MNIEPFKNEISCPSWTVTRYGGGTKMVMKSQGSSLSNGNRRSHDATVLSGLST